MVMASLHIPQVPRGAGKVCLLGGGETTCIVKGKGKGGRNQVVALVAGMELSNAGVLDTVVLSGGTDGQDGPTDAAGGFGDGLLEARCKAAGVVAKAALEDSDSYTLLCAVGDILKTGLTATNVMDVQCVLVNRE